MLKSLNSTVEASMTVALWYSLGRMLFGSSALISFGCWTLTTVPRQPSSIPWGVVVAMRAAPTGQVIAEIGMRTIGSDSYLSTVV